MKFFNIVYSCTVDKGSSRRQNEAENCSHRKKRGECCHRLVARLHRVWLARWCVRDYCLEFFGRASHGFIENDARIFRRGWYCCSLRTAQEFLGGAHENSLRTACASANVIVNFDLWSPGHLVWRFVRHANSLPPWQLRSAVEFVYPVALITWVLAVNTHSILWEVWHGLVEKIEYLDLFL